MKALSISLGLLFAALALPAAAAPWEMMEAQEGEYQLRYAYQTDDTGQYRFAVSCIIGNDGYNMFVLTPEAWEETTSYAPDVPVTMAFDGDVRPNLEFVFANGGGLVNVAYHEENFPGELGMLLDLIKAASRVEISYYDKAVAFSGEGSRAAIEAIAAACFG